MSPTLQLIATALFSLLGAFVGAWLTRRSEYEKWYRQEKHTAFAEYISQLYDTRLSISDIYYASEYSESEKNIKTTEAFVKLEKFVGLARLYMSPQGRVDLAAKQHQLWLDCTSRDGLTAKGSEIQIQMEAIQVLIEKELVYLPGKHSFSI